MAKRVSNIKDFFSANESTKKLKQTPSDSISKYEREMGLSDDDKQCSESKGSFCDSGVTESAECIGNSNIIFEDSYDSDDLENQSNVDSIESDVTAGSNTLLVPLSENESVIHSAVFQFPPDIAQKQTDEPSQPFLKHFPFRQFGDRKRNFQAAWYRGRSWLEYSITNDAAFCFPCRFFKANFQGPGMKTEAISFVNEGFVNWKKAMESNAGLKQHENSLLHKNCVASWEEFRALKSKCGPEASISSIIDKVYAQEVQENRLYIETIVEALRYTALQGIAQRGHSESDDSQNKGNFLELMDLLAIYNPVVKKKLESKIHKYTHHDFQNEIFQTMARKVLEIIKEETIQAKYFSIMIDESKDISKTEQLSIVIRYYLNGSVQERFLGFCAASQLDAASLFDLMKIKLSSCGIDLNMCVAQTYDGASVMSGSCAGVQALLTSEVPQAIYTHCMNHRINLVIVAVCKGIKSATDFFTILQSLYIFMSGSAIHPIFIQVQTDLKMKITRLKRLSDTRWTCQYASCIAVKSALSAVVATLSKIELNNCERASEAAGLLHRMDFSFIFHLCLFTVILKDTKILSDFLQGKNCNIVHAINLVESVRGKLKQMSHSDEDFQNIWEESVKCGEKIGVPIPSDISFAMRRRKLPKYLSEYLHNVAACEGVPVTYSDFKKKVFMKILNKVDEELNKRFTQNAALLQGMGALDPCGEQFLNIETLKPLARNYACDIDSLEAEIKILNNLLKRHSKETGVKVEDLPSLLLLLDKYKLALSEIHKLAQIVITIPASSASCERTFSCMKRVKSYLRNTMGHERLSNISVLAIERQLTKDLDLASIIDDFAVSHNNRRINLF